MAESERGSRFLEPAATHVDQQRKYEENSLGHLLGLKHPENEFKLVILPYNLLVLVQPSLYQECGRKWRVFVRN
jgi:hypothetical protein